MNAKAGKIIIKGVTNEGKKFRPSDWAQRLTTAVATYGPKRHIKFHKKVNMATIDGINCVVIDSGLEAEDPMLFSFLTNFAKNNNLEIIEDIESPEKIAEKNESM
jgi:hypothetical protein